MLFLPGSPIELCWPWCQPFSFCKKLKCYFIKEKLNFLLIFVFFWKYQQIFHNWFRPLDIFSWFFSLGFSPPTFFIFFDWKKRWKNLIKVSFWILFSFGMKLLCLLEHTHISIKINVLKQNAEGLVTHRAFMALTSRLLDGFSFVSHKLGSNLSISYFFFFFCIIRWHLTSNRAF